MNNPTAEQEINALIALQAYRRQLFKVAFMRKIGKCGVILMREENHLMRLWTQVKPMTAHKTRPAYEYLNQHTPFDDCRYVASKGRLPKDYHKWVQ